MWTVLPPGVIEPALRRTRATLRMRGLWCSDRPSYGVAQRLSVVSVEGLVARPDVGFGELLEDVDGGRGYQLSGGLRRERAD